MRLFHTLLIATLALSLGACSADNADSTKTNNKPSNNTNPNNNNNTNPNNTNPNNTNANNIKNNQSIKYEVKALSATVTGAFDAAWTKDDIKFEGYCVFGFSDLNWLGPNETAIKLSLKLDEPGTYTFDALPTDFGDKVGIGLMSVGAPASGGFYTRVASTSTITFEEVPKRPEGGKLKGTLDLNLFNPNKAQDPPVNIKLSFEHDFVAHLCA